MSVGTQIDVKTLGWVKQQVEESLKPAEQALESFADDPSDPELLQQCVEATCRVRGAIQMVGILGPSLLAQELENTVRMLAAGTIARVDDAYEVLMRGMLQLPGYLEQLYHGQQDIPLVLLPLLNDLRALQDAELLTESAFFNPDLPVSSPDARQGPGQSPWDAPTTGRKMRPGYLVALLGFIRNEDVDRNLQTLQSVINRMEQASLCAKPAQLWWIADGIVASLFDGGLEPTVAVKILLGRLDQQIKRVIREGEESLEAIPPNELIKNLLYYVAQSNSQAHNVQVIKHAFHLDVSLPDEHVLNRAKEDLYGFNSNLIGNISEQIREELFAIKDALDIAIHSKNGSTDGMEPVLGHMHNVADALGMLGLPKFRKLIHEHSQFLRPIIESKGTLEDDDVMRIAGAMLYVESSLYDLSAPNLDTDRPDATLPDVEYRQMIKATVEEILNDFKIIKDAINRFHDAPEDHDNLKLLLHKVHGIKGTAQMLRYPDQVNLMNAVESYISNEWSNEHQIPDQFALERLADAITGIEYFFESIAEKSVAPELGLQIAEQSLIALGYPPRKTLASRVAASVEAPKPKPARTSSAVIRVIDGKTGKETLHTIGVPAVASQVDDSELTTQFVQPDDVDDELVKVFLSEAEDVLNKIENDIVSWQRDSGDTKPLQKLIRSFHTLKGAGRIIGATSFGLLSWSIEELLRKVAEGPARPTEEMFVLLKHVTDSLRYLTAEMQGQAAAEPEADIQTLITTAREMRLVV